MKRSYFRSWYWFDGGAAGYRVLKQTVEDAKETTIDLSGEEYTMVSHNLRKHES